MDIVGCPSCAEVSLSVEAATVHASLHADPGWVEVMEGWRRVAAVNVARLYEERRK